MHYVVTWEIDIEADSPREAAEFARRHQADPCTTALFFECIDEQGITHRVDLLEERERSLEITQDGMGREFVCNGCGREESECSAEPCEDVIADREARI